uniref:Histonelysine Nmethyltransferase SETMARlike [Bombyx mori] n=1 Tax=Lepeophtheirus salmonis TaxID=72036 RepID=A0A0K2V5R9_LEPSM
MLTPLAISRTFTFLSSITI